jgi:ribosomal protein S1
MISDKLIRDKLQLSNDSRRAELPDLADSLWASVQQRYVIGSIVTGVLVRRNGKTFLIELEDGTLGWLHDHEVTWPNSEVMLCEALSLGQSMRL